MTNVAMFTTYAPSEGFGGPARAHHQRVVLESAGHTVTHVIIQSDAVRQSWRSTDLVELSERPFGATIDHIYSDVDLGQRAAADSRLVERVVAHLDSLQVAAIILEQPFLVELVALAARRLDIPVIYSSQNIEYRLRRDLERFEPNRHRAERSSEVRRLEQQAVDLSKVVTAICPTDQGLLAEEFGCESILVPNGSALAELPPSTPSYTTSDIRFAYAGSAYWPNLEGFAEMARPSLAFLPPNVRISVAGTAGPQLLTLPALLRWQSINASRLDVCGFVSMTEIMRLFSSANAVLVPVFVGEGSNLKSADALAAGAPAIMTRRAVRGYEDVLNLDDGGVTVVDSAEDFRVAMLDSVATQRTGVVGVRRRQRLTWAERLAPLVDVVTSVG